MVGSNCQIQSWFIHVLSTAFDTGHPSGGPDLPRPRQRTDRPVNKKKISREVNNCSSPIFEQLHSYLKIPKNT